MDIEEIRKYRQEINRIASKYGITKVSLFGSIARGESIKASDVDFLIEMQEGSSYLGVGGFLCEMEELLGVSVDVIPSSVLANVNDRVFIENVRSEAVAL